MTTKIRAGAGAGAEGATAALIHAAAQSHVKEFGGGRSVRLQKPSALAQFRLVKMVGPEVAKNSTLMMMYMPLMFIVELDGLPVAFPKAESEIEALISRLDDEGIQTVMLAVEEHWGTQAAPESQSDVKN